MGPLSRDDPRIVGPLPGPRSAAWLERDHRVMSPSYTRVYPLVVRCASGAMVEDMDATGSLTSRPGSRSLTWGTLILGSWRPFSGRAGG